MKWWLLKRWLYCSEEQGCLLFLLRPCQGSPKAYWGEHRKMILSLVPSWNLQKWDQVTVSQSERKRRLGCGTGSQRGREERGASLVLLPYWSTGGEAGTLPALLVEGQGRPFSRQCPASRKCAVQGMSLPVTHPPPGLAVLTSVGEPLHPVLEVTQVTVTLPGVVPNLQQLQAHQG